MHLKICSGHDNKAFSGLNILVQYEFRIFEVNREIIHINRPLVKSAYPKNNFLISQPKHMLWVLERTVSMRRFF